MKKDISVEELKMIQLKILDSIDDFCKKNGGFLILRFFNSSQKQRKTIISQVEK